jgi:hypothetical protein
VRSTVDTTKTGLIILNSDLKLLSKPTQPALCFATSRLCPNDASAAEPGQNDRFDQIDCRGLAGEV